MATRIIRAEISYEREADTSSNDPKFYGFQAEYRSYSDLTKTIKISGKGFTSGAEATNALDDAIKNYVGTDRVACVVERIYEGRDLRNKDVLAKAYRDLREREEAQFRANLPVPKLKPNAIPISHYYITEQMSKITGQQIGDWYVIGSGASAEHVHQSELVNYEPDTTIYEFKEEE